MTWSIKTIYSITFGLNFIDQFGIKISLMNGEKGSYQDSFYLLIIVVSFHADSEQRYEVFYLIFPFWTV